MSGLSTTRLRYVLWRAYGERCFYCHMPLEFSHVEVEHVIPASVSPEELLRSQTALGLPAGFGPDDLRNLVPACAVCNRGKGGSVRPDETIALWLELTRGRLAKVEQMLASTITRAVASRAMGTVCKALSEGVLTHDEVQDEVGNVPVDHDPDEPIVVCFGWCWDDLGDRQAEFAAMPYYAFCDNLLAELEARIVESGIADHWQTELDGRTGESQSVRYAVSLSDLDSLLAVDCPPWEPLEALWWSEVYAEDWRDGAG